MTENEVAKQIVDADYRVHTSLGPGLLESVYESVQAYELEHRGLLTTRRCTRSVFFAASLGGLAALREILPF
ncbi:MAG TPA: GxxExxY protein [Candidatus Acidoferrales bacterium]|nr:GxxExxY protein [Candidatus Acidoferrales bacterium]